MSVELAILDWVLIGAAIVLVLGGGFLGASSQLGTLSGFLTAPLAGYAGWGLACALVAELGVPEGTTATAISAIVDIVASLIVFGVVRGLVKKFVRGCLGGCANVIVGALVGLFLALALLALMVGVGMTPPGEYSRGFCAQRSIIVHDVAAWLDGHAKGRTQ